MYKALFNAKRQAFFWAQAAAIAGIMAGCSNPPAGPPDISDTVKPINKFVAKQSAYTGNDKIRYSYSYGDYDFYYIHLGVMENVPMFYLDPQYFGTTAEWTYQFTTVDISTATIRETVSQIKQTAVNTVDQKTVSKTTGTKLSQEINARYTIIDKVLDVGAKLAAEENWSKQVSNASTSGFTLTTSLTNSVEHVSTFTKEKREQYFWPLSKAKGDKEGWYRYTLFYATDIYLYVIKDPAGVVSHEFVEHVKQDVFGWMLDYSEDMAFERSDASGFEFDVSILDNLPKPGLAFAVPPTPGNVSALARSSNRIEVSWDPVNGANFYEVYRSTSENGVYSPVLISYSASCRDSGLSAATTYYYRVRAVDSNGSGMLSASAYATTKAPMDPAAVRYSKAGSYTYTFKERSPVQVEVYVLGAGGGGQGGNMSEVLGSADRGTGGAGGGGAAAYMMFAADETVTFDITVGEGGQGGSSVHVGLLGTWQSGNPGAAGGSTSVSVGSTTIIAGGGGGAGGASQNLTGGIGGRVGSGRPAGLLDWVAEPGNPGSNGVHAQDIKATSEGGSAASISKGSEVFFGGGLGAASDRAAQSGGGGKAGYSVGSEGTGGNGGDGYVVIVITEL